MCAYRHNLCVCVHVLFHHPLGIPVAHRFCKKRLEDIDDTFSANLSWTSSCVRIKEYVLISIFRKHLYSTGMPCS